MGLGKVRKLYVPYYTCEVVLEPLQRLGIAYKFYHIEPNLEIGDTGMMSGILDGEYLLINNYFGIKDSYIENLSQQLSGHIIVENSQSLFTPLYNDQPTFWSPRKFVGVPDGGIAMPIYNIEITEQDRMGFDTMFLCHGALLFWWSVSYPISICGARFGCSIYKPYWWKLFYLCD